MLGCSSKHEQVLGTCLQVTATRSPSCCRRRGVTGLCRAAQGISWLCERAAAGRSLRFSDEGKVPVSILLQMGHGNMLEGEAGAAEMLWLAGLLAWRQQHPHLPGSACSAGHFPGSGLFALS